MNPVDRFLTGFARSMLLGAGPRRPSTPVSQLEPVGAPSHRRRSTWVLATVAPATVALAFVPVRSDHAAAAAEVLVVPVLVAAIVGGTGPALVAAGVAGLGFGVLLTEPYGRFVIDDPDDVVTTVTLLVVASVAGTLSARLLRLTVRAAARRDELDRLVAFVALVDEVPTAQALEAAAVEHRSALLDLRRCDWRPGYQGTAGPVVLPSGLLREGAPGATGRRPPTSLELPAVAAGRELGRFVVAERAPGASVEERATAMAVVTLFARSLATRAAAP